MNSNGASSGIGKGIVIHFAQLGCRLAITGRNADNLDKVSAECKKAGLSEDMVIAIKGDINNEEDRVAIVKKAVDKFGEINVLKFYNAGAVYNTSISDVTPQIYDFKFDTNTRSQVFFTKLVLPYLIKSKGVRFHYILHDQSKYGYVYTVLGNRNGTSWRKSKFNKVSNILRRSYGGTFQDGAKYQEYLTSEIPKHPLGRVGHPEDCAAAVEFLASDAASFITGQLLYVDGERHCLSTGIPYKSIATSKL